MRPTFSRKPKGTHLSLCQNNRAEGTLRMAQLGGSGRVLAPPPGVGEGLRVGECVRLSPLLFIWHGVKRGSAGGRGQRKAGGARVAGWCASSKLTMSMRAHHAAAPPTETKSGRGACYSSAFVFGALLPCVPTSDEATEYRTSMHQVLSDVLSAFGFEGRGARVPS